MNTIVVIPTCHEALGAETVLDAVLRGLVRRRQAIGRPHDVGV